jgi:hypothetical protein
MEKSSEKRSAFDILMSKKRDQKSKQENELNTSFNSNKNNDSTSSDIILIENKSITNQDIIELDSVCGTDSTSTKKQNNKKELTLVQNENLNKRDKVVEIDKKKSKAISDSLEESKDLFLHVQQYSGERNIFEYIKFIVLISSWKLPFFNEFINKSMQNEFKIGLICNCN